MTSSSFPTLSAYLAKQVLFLSMALGSATGLFGVMMMTDSHRESEQRLQNISNDFTGRSLSVFSGMEAGQSLKSSWPAEAAAISRKEVRSNVAPPGLGMDYVSDYDGDLLVLRANEDNIALLPATGNEAGQMVVASSSQHILEAYGCLYVDPTLPVKQNVRVVDSLLRAIDKRVGNLEARYGTYTLENGDKRQVRFEETAKPAIPCLAP